MKCPVELARDLSAEGVDRVNPSGGRRDDEGIPGRRLGAGDEGTGSDSAGDGEEDYLVAGGGDHRPIGPEYAAVAVALRAVWLRRVVRPAAGGGGGRGGAGR